MFTVTQWEKPDMLQGENTAEQVTSVSVEQSSSTSDGDQISTAGTKRSSGDCDDDSAAKRPYDGRGYHRGAYGGWTVVAERLAGTLLSCDVVLCTFRMRLAGTFSLNYREQVPFEEEDATEERQEEITHQEAESCESDSEVDDTKDFKVKEMFKERTVDSLEDTMVKEEKIEPGTFGGFGFKKRNLNFKKPQIRQRINENDY